MNLMVTPFFDPDTGSYTYVVVEPCSRPCAVIDPVLNYDPETGKTSTALADGIVTYVKANDLIVEWLLETHVHADHLSATPYLKTRFVCAQSGIGAGILEVRDLIDPDAPDPTQRFDRLLQDGDRIALGHASGRVLATPGHTPACMSYRFEDLVFVGDVIFMPDFGSGRCDFPGGDPGRLFDSVQSLLRLPGRTRLFTGHDYGPGGRPVSYLSTVQEQRAKNIHFATGTDKARFVQMRTSRDAGLEPPALLDVAVAFNLSGGSTFAHGTTQARNCAA